MSFCNTAEVLSVMRIVKIVINIIKIVVPIMLIVRGMLDFVSAITSTEVNVALKTLVTRTIVAVLIFFIPTFVDIIANLLDFKEDYYACIKNATPEGIENARIEAANENIMLAKNTLMDAYYYQAMPYINKITNEQKRNELKEKLEEIHVEIEKANKEREEKAMNSYANTGVYTRSEMMDTDEQKVKDMSNDEFIEYVGALARDVYHEYGGVLPSITVAQACLESGYGNSFEATSHNFYGLMGYPDSKPKVINLRKFENFYEATYYHYQYFNAFEVYELFLQRCKNNDPMGASEELKRYAGEDSYPGKIQWLIEHYNLTRFDN